MWILGYLCILASFDWSTFDNEVELNACLAVFEIVKGIGKWHLKQNVPKLLFNWCNNSICLFLSSFFISSKIQMKMGFFIKRKYLFNWKWSYIYLFLHCLDLHMNFVEPAPANIVQGFSSNQGGRRQNDPNLVEKYEVIIYW